MDRLSAIEQIAIGSGVDQLGIDSVPLYMAAQITSGGLSGGLGSVIAGGNFWKGAEQGVIATTYNHAVHGLYNKITEDGESPYDGYKKDKNGNYIRVDGRGDDKIDYLYDEEGNIIASTPVSFTEIEVGPYRRTYGQGTKYVSPALYDPTFDVFASWASGKILGAAAVKVFRYLSGVGRGVKGLNAYRSLADKFGKGYKSISAIQGKYIPIELGQKLNKFSRGSWSKVYEAGILDGSKVEVHYFYNARTGEYINPFIKSSGWKSSGLKGITGY